MNLWETWAHSTETTASLGFRPGHRAAAVSCCLFVVSSISSLLPTSSANATTGLHDHTPAPGSDCLQSLPDLTFPPPGHQPKINRKNKPEKKEKWLEYLPQRKWTFFIWFLWNGVTTSMGSQHYTTFMWGRHSQRYGSSLSSCCLWQRPEYMPKLVSAKRKFSENATV